MAGLYLLLFLSVSIETFKNIYYNFFGKNLLKTNKDTVFFNIICTVGSVLFFAAVLLVTGEDLAVSNFSFILSIIFAFVTVTAQYFGLLSMSLGPMSFSVLFTYLSALIPTIFGIVYRSASPAPNQYVGLALMVLTFILSVDFSENSGMSLKWGLAVFGSFMGMGLLGVCQTVHQVSDFAFEINGFLFWTFLFTLILFILLYIPYALSGENESKEKNAVPAKDYCLMLITGLIIAAINLINLYLSGVMPSVIFFPIVNGGVIILSGLASIFIFKEKLPPKKIAGLIIGIIAVCLIGIEL